MFIAFHCQTILLENWQNTSGGNLHHAHACSRWSWVIDENPIRKYTRSVKVVGYRKPSNPVEYLRESTRLYESLERWNPYPRPRGKVFKFRTWEDLEKWRQSQSNPRLR